MHWNAIIGFIAGFLIILSNTLLIVAIHLHMKSVNRMLRAMEDHQKALLAYRGYRVSAEKSNSP